ncbi:MAG: magnesium/cobalt transporter CorA [Bacteroidales bacterium]|nr:magnesium/cobalt transporter CorA [Bacteroidales bacterium]
MARFIKKNKNEIGLSPYTLHYTGKKLSDAVLLRMIDYDAENLNEIELKEISEAFKFQETNTTSWFNVDHLHDEEIMQKISSGFKIEPFIISDAMNTNARPKIQEYDDCIYISLKMLQYDETDSSIASENFVLILKQSILLTFQEKKGDVFEPVRERIRKSKRKIRLSGPDYLTFSLLDIIIDNYLYIIGRIGDKIESLEEEMLGKPSQDTIDEINHFKREIIFLNKSIKPSKELLLEFAKIDSELISEDVYGHINGLQSNVNHCLESLESYREILNDQLNSYHTTVSSNLNEIMRFLTVFSVIFIPLTFIAGIYGTNFDVLPELHFKYSYFIMWAMMILIALGMLFYFKRKKWL